MARIRVEDWLTEDGLQKIELYKRRGLSDKAIAAQIGIGERTFSRWKKDNVAITAALKKGREGGIDKVETTLFEKAMGYTDKEGNYHPPDTTAAIFVLKNNRRQCYQDRPKTDEELEAIRLENELKRRQLESKNSDDKSPYMGLPIDTIIPVFAPLHYDIANKAYTEYVLPGGRGSTKSSFISLEIINLIEKNPDMHALCCRQIAKDLRRSVFNQVVWAIEKLGLLDEYETTVSPLEITKKSTGQKIYFAGLSDPKSLKSIKTPFGYIGILWFEELDQYKGDEAIRKVEESVIRGGEDFYEFKSFNPPKSKNNWANMYADQKNPNMNVYESTYLDVPKEWLGEAFIKKAEWLKEVNPDAYNNEYLGEANGSGGNVLPNLEIRTITDEEIATFDDPVNGVDFGWVHPQAFVRAQFYPQQQVLIPFAEGGGSYVKNKELAEQLKNSGVGNDIVKCDNAEPKAVYELQENGINAIKAKKGPGSRDYGFKWLASLVKIVIDPERTPRLYEQAVSLEYERDQMGNLTSLIPKINDDWVDALRYATEQYQLPEYDPFN